MQIFISITLWLLMGAISAYYAQVKGRDPITWFFLGCLLGVIGLIILFFLPTLETKVEPEMTLEDAIKSHDCLVQDSLLTVEWYYLDQEHKQQGPLKIDQLKKLWFNHEITNESLVWSEGMKDWMKLDAVQDLKAKLQNS